MNKGKSKKKMNSYLKMVLIMLAGGVVGGIFGFVTSYTGENSIAAIGHGMNAFLLAVRDHTVLLECICGAGQMIRGFDAAVADMEVGQIIDVHLYYDL